MVKKITLLEGVPFERELISLKAQFATTKFTNLFRTSKIYLYMQSSYHHPNRQTKPPITQAMIMPQMIHPRLQSFSQLSNGPTQEPAGVQQPAQMQNGINRDHQFPYKSLTPSTSSTPTTNSAPTAATSWANRAMSAPPAQLTPSPPTPTLQPRAPSILRNKFGQRIDNLTKFDLSEVKRVQKIKMCNVHILRRECPYRDKCTHDHFYKPNKNEQDILMQLGRGTPCKFGTGCDDMKCIYGHR